MHLRYRAKLCRRKYLPPAAAAAAATVQGSNALSKLLVGISKDGAAAVKGLEEGRLLKTS